MPNEIQLKIDTSKFEQRLRAEPPKVANEYLTTALTKAGEVILPVMKDLAPERTDEATPEGNSLPPGILKYDLTIQVKLDSHGADLKVGPTAVSGYVARWQNNGWNLTSHSGNAIKAIPGKHFMESAIDETRQAAIDAFVNSLASSLDSAK